MKAVLLARVSDREQELSGHSLPAQVEKLRSYGERKAIEIAEEFVFQESAGPKIRKKFESMLSYLRRNKTVRVLLCMNVDRLTRNFRDMVDLDEMRRNDGLEIHFIQEGLVLNARSSGTELFMWEAKVFIAKQYINRLSDDAKRSVDYKLNKGEWVARAPLGYLNQRDKEGHGDVVMDGERALLVKRLFEEYSTGLRSIEEIVGMAAGWGLTTRAGKKVMKTTMFTILQNPFYCGDMVLKGAIYPHRYPALISRALFAKCQDVRLGRTVKRTAQSEKPFIFRGLITCAVTGRVVISDQKKGKYNYLICGDPAKPGKKIWVPEGIVLKQVQQAIEQLHIPADVLEQLLGEMRNVFDSEKAFHRESTGELKRQITLIQTKLDKLTDLLLEDTISPDEHRVKRNALVSEREGLKDRVQQHDEGDDAFRESLESLLSLCSRAPHLFASSSVELKREMTNFVLSNLKLRGTTLCYDYKEPFNVFAEMAQKKNGDPYSTSLELVNIIRNDVKLKLIVCNTYIPPMLLAA